MSKASKEQKENITMDSNETFLKERYGKGNPFRVPKGYFDGLSSRVMSALPDTVPSMVVVKNSRRGLRLWLGIAACLCFVVFGAAVCFTALTSDKGSVAAPTAAETAQQVSSASYAEEVADYAMMDNADIYAYLCNE